MQKSSVAVLDIGSSKVTAMIGQRGVNNTFIFKAVKTVSYSGFEDGAFFDLEDLSNAVKAAISSVEANCKTKLKHIYVGAPGEFVLVKTKRHLIAFNGKKRIGAREIDRLTSESFDFEIKGYTLIKTAPVYYILSDKTRTVYPEKHVTDTLEGYLSYFLCDDGFITVLNSILTPIGMESITYLPVSLAEAEYLIRPEKRDETALLADVGYISSTFSVVGGNGVLYQKSFSRGGGYITAYLSEGLDIDFDLAEQIKQRANLSFNATDSDIYEIYQGEDVLSFNARQVNEIIGFGLDEICECLSDCIDGFKEQNIDSKTLLLTGGALHLIRGSHDYLSKRLGRVVESIAPNLPYFNKPPQSSILSLLNMALNENQNNSKGIIKKLFN